MDPVQGTLATISAIARPTIFGVAALAGLVALIDWAVRTRRVSPFGRLARFFRKTVDPLLEPVEQRVVRAGGLPTSAPWWALVVVVVGGLLFLGALNLIMSQWAAMRFASEQGSLGLLHLVVGWTFSILRLALIVRVISSWIRVSPFSPWIRWTYPLTEWLLRPLRRIVPNVGMFDVTPLLAYLILIVAEWLVMGVLP
jgi:YggT family protein